MMGINRKFISALQQIGPRFLPFADAATSDLPLSRLLRLSLFQVSVGMALVLLTGTLNRVMIVELDVPAWLVGLMVSIPVLIAPFRALIGFKSDTHKSVLGWRRVPYIWFGTMMQFGGFAILPFALLVLTGDGHGSPMWGEIGAALAFLLIGAGINTTQTAGLALANDPFSMDGDGDLVSFATQQHDRYANQKAQALQRAANYRLAAWALSPTLLGSLIAEWQAVVAEREAAAADKAARWYRDANDSYKQLVGARVMQVNAEGYWCRCRDEYNAPTWYPVNDPADCFGDGDCLTFPIYEYQLVEKPSDGVVLAESAGILNGAVASVLMPSTNHQQMRNSSVTKSVLNRVMNGQIPGGAFFATPTR